MANIFIKKREREKDFLETCFINLKETFAVNSKQDLLWVEKF